MNRSRSGSHHSRSSLSSRSNCSPQQHLDSPASTSSRNSYSYKGDHRSSSHHRSEHRHRRNYSDGREHERYKSEDSNYSKRNHSYSDTKFVSKQYSDRDKYFSKSSSHRSLDSSREEKTEIPNKQTFNSNSEVKMTAAYVGSSKINESSNKSLYLNPSTSILSACDPDNKIALLERKLQEEKRALQLKEEERIAYEKKLTNDRQFERQRHDSYNKHEHKKNELLSSPDKAIKENDIPKFHYSHPKTNQNNDNQNFYDQSPNMNEHSESREISETKNPFPNDYFIIPSIPHSDNQLKLDGDVQYEQEHPQEATNDLISLEKKIIEDKRAYLEKKIALERQALLKKKAILEKQRKSAELATDVEAQRKLIEKFQKSNELLTQNIQALLMWNQMNPLYVPKVSASMQSGLSTIVQSMPQIQSKLKKTIPLVPKAYTGKGLSPSATWSKPSDSTFLSKVKTSSISETSKFDSEKHSHTVIEKKSNDTSTLSLSLSNVTSSQPLSYSTTNFPAPVKSAKKPKQKSPVFSQIIPSLLNTSSCSSVTTSDSNFKLSSYQRSKTSPQSQNLTATPPKSHFLLNAKFNQDISPSAVKTENQAIMLSSKTTLVAPSKSDPVANTKFTTKNVSPPAVVNAMRSSVGKITGSTSLPTTPKFGGKLTLLEYKKRKKEGGSLPSSPVIHDKKVSDHAMENGFKTDCSIEDEYEAFMKSIKATETKKSSPTETRKSSPTQKEIQAQQIPKSLNENNKEFCESPAHVVASNSFKRTEVKTPLSNKSKSPAVVENKEQREDTETKPTNILVVTPTNDIRDKLNMLAKQRGCSFTSNSIRDSARSSAVDSISNSKLSLKNNPAKSKTRNNFDLSEKSPGKENLNEPSQLQTSENRRSSKSNEIQYIRTSTEKPAKSTKNVSKTVSKDEEKFVEQKIKMNNSPSINTMKNEESLLPDCTHQVGRNVPKVPIALDNAQNRSLPKSTTDKADGKESNCQKVLTSEEGAVTSCISEEKNESSNNQDIPIIQSKGASTITQYNSIHDTNQVIGKRKSKATLKKQAFLEELEKSKKRYKKKQNTNNQPASEKNDNKSSIAHSKDKKIKTNSDEAKQLSDAQSSHDEVDHLIAKTDDDQKPHEVIEDQSTDTLCKTPKKRQSRKRTYSSDANTSDSTTSSIQKEEIKAKARDQKTLKNSIKYKETSVIPNEKETKVTKVQDMKVNQPKVANKIPRSSPAKQTEEKNMKEDKIVNSQALTFDSMVKFVLNTPAKEKKFKCKSCEAVFWKEQELRNHSLIHKLKTYDCYKCEDKFTTMRALTKHLLVHNEMPRVISSTRPHDCDRCGEKFETENQLLVHLQIHDMKELDHVCAFCSAKYHSLSELYSHIQQQHPEGMKEVLRCSLCGVQFKNLGEFRIHLLKIHHMNNKEATLASRNKGIVPEEYRVYLDEKRKILEKKKRNKGLLLRSGHTVKKSKNSSKIVKTGKASGIQSKAKQAIQRSKKVQRTIQVSRSSDRIKNIVSQNSHESKSAEKEGQLIEVQETKESQKAKTEIEVKENVPMLLKEEDKVSDMNIKAKDDIELQNVTEKDMNVIKLQEEAQINKELTSGSILSEDKKLTKSQNVSPVQNSSGNVSETKKGPMDILKTPNVESNKNTCQENELIVSKESKRQKISPSPKKVQKQTKPISSEMKQKLRSNSAEKKIELTQTPINIPEPELPKVMQSQNKELITSTHISNKVAENKQISLNKSIKQSENKVTNTKRIIITKTASLAKKKIEPLTNKTKPLIKSNGILKNKSAQKKLNEQKLRNIRMFGGNKQKKKFKITMHPQLAEIQSIINKPDHRQSLLAESQLETIYARQQLSKVSLSTSLIESKDSPSSVTLIKSLKGPTSTSDNISTINDNTSIKNMQVFSDVEKLRQEEAEKRMKQQFESAERTARMLIRNQRRKSDDTQKKKKKKYSSDHKERKKSKTEQIKVKVHIKMSDYVTESTAILPSPVTSPVPHSSQTNKFALPNASLTTSQQLPKNKRKSKELSKSSDDYSSKSETAKNTKRRRKKYYVYEDELFARQIIEKPPLAFVDPGLTTTALLEASKLTPTDLALIQEEKHADPYLEQFKLDTDYNYLAPNEEVFLTEDDLSMSLMTLADASCHEKQVMIESYERENERTVRVLLTNMVDAISDNVENPHQCANAPIKQLESSSDRYPIPSKDISSLKNLLDGLVEAVENRSDLCVESDSSATTPESYTKNALDEFSDLVLRTEVNKPNLKDVSSFSRANVLKVERSCEDKNNILNEFCDLVCQKETLPLISVDDNHSKQSTLQNPSKTFKEISSPRQFINSDNIKENSSSSSRDKVMVDLSDDTGSDKTDEVDSSSNNQVIHSSRNAEAVDSSSYYEAIASTHKASNDTNVIDTCNKYEQPNEESIRVMEKILNEVCCNVELQPDFISESCAEKNVSTELFIHSKHLPVVQLNEGGVEKSEQSNFSENFEKTVPTQENSNIPENDNSCQDFGSKIDVLDNRKTIINSPVNLINPSTMSDFQIEKQFYKHTDFDNELSIARELLSDIVSTVCDLKNADMENNQANNNTYENIDITDSFTDGVASNFSLVNEIDYGGKTFPTCISNVFVKEEPTDFEEVDEVTVEFDQDDQEVDNKNWFHQMSIASFPSSKLYSCDRNIDLCRNIKPFTCLYCEKSFKLQSRYSSHSCISQNDQSASTRKSKKVLSCLTCGLVFTKKCHLKLHLSHHNLKFSCIYCSTISPNNSSYKFHFSKKHALTKTYKCKICLKQFLSRYTLQNHSCMKNFVCNVCGMNFSRKNTLKRHEIFVHTRNNESLKCIICARTFMRRAYLMSHMKCHDGILPFRCLYCGKYFRQQQNLYTHNQKCHNSSHTILECT